MGPFAWLLHLMESRSWHGFAWIAGLPNLVATHVRPWIAIDTVSILYDVGI